METPRWRETFKDYRKRKPSSLEEAHDEGAKALLDVVNAFRGIVPDYVVIKAIGDTNDPNTISRVIRNTLPPIK